MKDSKADDPVKSIKENTTFEIDLIATICTMPNVPNIYEEFARNFVRSFKQLDIVADTYRENSMKRGGRSTHGSSQKFMIAS